MREACHHNLYAMANSSGMNGIGADTVVKRVTPGIISKVQTAAIASGVLLVLFAALWIRGAKKFRKTEEYAAWKTLKKAK